MLYPSIDSLLTKIDSKYSLVSVAAKRARYMQESGESTKIAKPVSGRIHCLQLCKPQGIRSAL